MDFDGDFNKDSEQQKIKRVSEKGNKRKSALLTTKQYHTHLDLIKTNKMNTRQSTLRDALGEVRKTKSTAAQIKLAHETRQTLFDTIYPLPHKYKSYAWAFLVFWTIFVVIMSWNYGIQFDLNYEKEKNAADPNLSKYDEDCWENNALLSLANLLSIRNFEDLQDSIKSAYNGDYDDDLPETGKWLLNCLQSLVLSVFLWQPLTVYIITWIKIWMFSWNLRMKLAPGNIKALCMKACSKEDPENLRKEIYQAGNQSKSKKQQSYYIIAHQDRPLDIIGYFSNDDLFLKMDEETGKLKEIESESESLNTDDEEDDDERLLSTENNKKKAVKTDDGAEGGGENTEMEMVALTSNIDDEAPIVQPEPDSPKSDEVALQEVEKPKEAAPEKEKEKDNDDEALIFVNVDENKPEANEDQKDKEEPPEGTPEPEPKPVTDKEEDAAPAKEDDDAAPAEKNEIEDQVMDQLDEANDDKPKKDDDGYAE